ncbi:MAG: hypothetical protein LBM98_06655 [Oscillospiraceae bacterium]|nr:hypothetical protein [Oscillospiraceae bacterium]
MRRTGKPAIRRMIQVRSTPGPGGQPPAYVPTYRRIVRQPWIASPRINGTYRKCGGGFAKTVRRPGAPRAGASPASLGRALR